VGRNVLAARQRTEPLIEWSSIVIWKDAHREVVRRRSLATEVTERTPIDLIAPHPRAKKRSRECPTHSPGIVLEMKIPQEIHGYEHGLRPIPAPSNGDLLVTALIQIMFSSCSGRPLSIRSYARSDRSNVTNRPWQINSATPRATTGACCNP
jgi:hypothetical protein